jgi:hypothetical protein
MPLFRWEDIDHSLMRLRLIDLAEEMQRQIQEDESCIQFENRGNLNSNTVPSLVLKMKQERAEEQARRVYEIYCDVWEKQGYVKSAAFVRAVCARGIVPVFRARKGAIAGEFSMFATRTSFPPALRDTMMKGFQLNMQRLEDRWRRRLEIEAKECEHAEQRLRASQQTLQRAHVGATMAPTEVPAEPIRQPLAGEGHQEVRVSESGLNRRKPGRSPKVAQPFVVCAGTLWRKAISESHTKVSNDQLRQIASALDEAGHLPPAAHLEGTFAQEVKAYNSRNSNSKVGPVKTWTQLISLGDKDHLRGMRRLLSRCAKKLDDGHLSGN